MRTIYTLLFTPVFAFSLNASAGPAEFFRIQMQKSCQDKEFRSIANVSDSACKAKMDKIADTCTPKINNLIKNDSDANEAALQNCINSAMKKHFGIDPSQFEDNYNESDEDNLSDEEKMENVDKLMAEAAKTNALGIDISEVSLPVFPGAMPVSSTATLKMEKKGFLPAVILVSTKPVNDVVAFYKKKLSSYKQYKIDGGWIFLEKGVEGKFDYLKHFQIVTATPHVTITEYAMGKSSGFKTNIEIGYKK
ncbi:MAG: hypothetical protein D6B27_04890 [Gammaproteobacteria bacterium]|nr:MAG: hypothetical protein D6B27_04890 [Gammaproteobacteria bacterium]